MSYSSYLWHLDMPDERNFLEAEYISFLIRLAEKKLGVKYKKILDLACGVGRHHKFLRENGFEIYGVDSSRELIRLAKEKNKNFENFYKVEDMRRIDYRAEFDVVLNWYTSFGYFSDKENKLVLENIYKALKPSGIFILELPVKWSEGNGVIFHEDQLVEVIQRRKIDSYRFEYQARLYKKEGKNLTFKAKLKLILTIYPPHILKSMLETIGFKILYVFANYGIINVRNFDLTDLVERGVRRLVWIAYK